MAPTDSANDAAAPLLPERVPLIWRSPKGAMTNDDAAAADGDAGEQQQRQGGGNDGGDGGGDADLFREYIRAHRQSRDEHEDDDGGGGSPIGRADDGASDVNASPQSLSRRAEPTSWADLFPADLLGSLATFLDPESVGNLAVTAGPQMNPIVKKAYLNRNLRYLSRNLENRAIFRAFLEANDDWRDWYDGRELLSAEDRKLFDFIFNKIDVVICLGQVEVVKHLIEVRGHDVNETVKGSSLLKRATRWGNLQMVEYILGIPGLDINARDSGGDSTLHAMVSDGKNSLVCFEALLLHRGIDVNIRGKGGNTPLHRAAAIGPNDEMLLLLRHDDIDVDAVNESGCTPLHFAAMNWAHEGDEQHERVVKHLIEAGADPHAQGTDGCTPLACIEVLGNEEQAALLKDWIRNNRGAKREAATG